MKPPTTITQFRKQLAEIVPVYLQDAEAYRDAWDAENEAFCRDEEAAKQLEMDCQE